MNEVSEKNKKYIMDLIQRVKKLGYSQREIAKKLGITEASLSRYINGSRNPRYDIIIRLEEEFLIKKESEVDLGDLIIKISKLNPEYQNEIEKIVDSYTEIQQFNNNLQTQKKLNISL